MEALARHESPIQTLALLLAVHAPRWMMFASAVVVLDLTGWLVHWAMHKVGLLWQVHCVHHSDLRSDLLRMHHSADVADSMSNFGIVFSRWDRLAGTYRAPSAWKMCAILDVFLRFTW